MAFASSDGLYLQSISVPTEAALSAVETSDLVDGDIAFVDADFDPDQASTQAWWILLKNSTSSVGANILYSKNAASTPGNGGRWKRLTVAYSP